MVKNKVAHEEKNEPISLEQLAMFEKMTLRLATLARKNGLHERADRIEEKFEKLRTETIPANKK